MGNCLFGGGVGIGETNDGVLIKVVTTNGGIMEFCGPMTVEFITDEFPGHGIFRSRDLFWKPLAHREVMQAGEYYLLPLDNDDDDDNRKYGSTTTGTMNINGHVRSNSVPQFQSNSTLAVPYRMSFDSQGILKRSHTELFCRSSNSNGIGNNIGGFWKVKLVISPQHLLEILSQETRTQELVESVRTVAKCRNGLSSMVFPDQWSLSSSRNAFTKKDAF